jgi:hypothetical protein
VVKVDGCALELLAQCKLPGEYRITETVFLDVRTRPDLHVHHDPSRRPGENCRRPRDRSPRRR